MTSRSGNVGIVTAGPVRLTVVTLAVVGMACASALGGVVPARAAEATGASGTTLAVGLVGLPGSVRANLVLHGPQRYLRHLSGGTHLRGLAPGTYTLDVDTARGAGATWTARHPHVTVHLSRSATVTASYGAGKKDAVTVLHGASLLAAAPTPGGGGSVTVTKSAANKLTPGGYVVLGAGPVTPQGFIGQVTSVTPAAGGGETVHTRPAKLIDVLPEGSLNVDTSVLTPQNLSPRATAHAEEGDESIAQNIGCGATSSLILTGSAGVSADLKLAADWHFHIAKLPTVTTRAEAILKEHIDLAARLSGQATCTLKDTKIGKLIPLGEYTIDVAGVPVVLTPKLQFSVSGTASADADISSSYHQSITVDGGVDYDGHRAKPFSNFTPTSTFAPPTLHGRGVLEGTLTAKVVVGLYGADDGIDVTADGTLALNADTAKNPWWNLDLDIDGKAGADLDSLDLHVPDIDLFRKTIHLTDAGGPFSLTPVTPTPPVPPAASVPAVPAAGIGSKQILVYGDNDEMTPDGDGTGMNNIADALTDAGFKVTTIDDDTDDTDGDLPTDISAYGQIWHYGVEDDFTEGSGDVTRLEDFAKAGGGVFLTGEWDSSRFSVNDADVQFLDDVVNPRIGSAEDDDQSIELDLNTDAILGNITTYPNYEDQLTSNRYGGLTGVGSTNDFMDNNDGDTAGAAFDLGAGQGRIAIVMDSNWVMSQNDDDEQTTGLIENIGNFLDRGPSS